MDFTEHGARAKPDGRESAIAEFVSRHLDTQPTSVNRIHAFAINAVYEVELPSRRVIVKTSPGDAIRGEAWALEQARLAGAASPELLAFADHDGQHAILMSRVPGESLDGPHPALTSLGSQLRGLHEHTASRFGWFWTARWNDEGEFTLPQDSWSAFVEANLRGFRRLTALSPRAEGLEQAARDVVDRHAAALDAVRVGSICHGDLVLRHVLVEDQSLGGIIDWGDVIVADPIWDLGRFARHADAGSQALLMRGYDPEDELAEECAWKVPLYCALWTVVAAIVESSHGGAVAHHLDAIDEALQRADQA